MSKLCECGCGAATAIPTETSRRDGQFKGVPRRFIHGHNATGANNYAWKGGKKITKRGYVLMSVRNHPKADGGKIYEHVAIAEKP